METIKDNMKRIPITLREIIKEADMTFTYKFNKPEGISWTAGANAHFAVPESKGDLINDKRFIRHLSIINSPEDDYIGFTTRAKKVRSEFKSSLSRLKAGETLELFKIQNRIPLLRENRPAVLISMGVAISTMKPLIMEYMNNHRNIPKLTNINIDRSGQFIYKKELDALNNGNCDLCFVETREAFFQAIKETCTEKRAQYYIAGSDQFLKEIAAFLLKNDIKKDSLYFDVKESKLDSIFSE
jgi:ferredoxin--NADP+ reductase